MSDDVDPEYQDLFTRFGHRAVKLSQATSTRQRLKATNETEGEKGIEQLRNRHDMMRHGRIGNCCVYNAI